MILIVLGEKCSMVMSSGNSRFFKHVFVYQEFENNLLAGLVDIIAPWLQWKMVSWR